MMTDLKPLIWNWPAVVKGDSYPACQITESLSDTDLERVLVTIRPQGSDTTALSLDSETSGVTINSATAGAWNFTIRSITANETDALAAGFYTYGIQTTDITGFVRTEFAGTWQIITEPNQV